MKPHAAPGLRAASEMAVRSWRTEAHTEDVGYRRPARIREVDPRTNTASGSAACTGLPGGGFGARGCLGAVMW